MNFLDHVRSTRTCRRFDARRELDPTTLSWLVDCARQTSSGGNLQPLRYVTVQKPEAREKLYPALGWAGYLKDWDGPVEEERPTGYILVLTELREDSKPSHMAYIDLGIAAQTIQLAARSRELGTCIFLSFKERLLKESLPIPDGYTILSVIAVGTPVEEVQIVSLPEDGSVKYYRNEAGVHFVPKRSLQDVLLAEM